MGAKQSKNRDLKDCDYPPAPISHKIQIMITKYGKQSTGQLDIWVNECDFPSTGSFSLRQLQALKTALEEKEKQSREKRRNKKNRKVFEADWSAYSCWLREAQIRDRKQQKGRASLKPKSQRLKLDPDLDSATPRRQQQGDEPPPSPVPQPSPSIRVVQNPQPQLQPSPSNRVVQNPQPQLQPSLSKMEVVIYRTWTFKDMKAAFSHLPQVEDGGAKFAAELEDFCQVFAPTTLELWRLLMVHMGFKGAEVWPNLPTTDLSLRNMDWEHPDNVYYREMITRLCKRITAAFPPRVDMEKISMCEQETDETVSAFLTRLTEVYTAYSGLTVPEDMGRNPITAWEAFLRDRFLHSIKPEISGMVKRYCIAWNNASIQTVKLYAIRAEECLKDKEKKESARKACELWNAQRGLRGRGRGQRGRSQACFICGEMDHWARDCQYNKKNRGYRAVGYHREYSTDSWQIQ